MKTLQLCLVGWLTCLAASLAGDVTIRPQGRHGLVLLIAGESMGLWKNTKVHFPSQDKSVELYGSLLVPGGTKSLRLRSAVLYGSERLQFTVDGKPLDFKTENGPDDSRAGSVSHLHRFVTVDLTKGGSLYWLEIGHSVAQNPWDWGPLQWSLNGGAWTNVPVDNLFVK